MQGGIHTIQRELLLNLATFLVNPVPCLLKNAHTIVVFLYKNTTIKNICGNFVPTFIKNNEQTEFIYIIGQC